MSWHIWCRWMGARTWLVARGSYWGGLETETRTDFCRDLFSLGRVQGRAVGQRPVMCRGLVWEIPIYIFNEDSYFNFFQKSLFCMLPSFATCPKVFKTVFVFALRPFLPMSVLFFGFNGNFNGKMTKINKMAKNHFSGVQNGSQSV